jgi:hypothetical protein
MKLIKIILAFSLLGTTLQAYATPEATQATVQMMAKFQSNDFNSLKAAKAAAQDIAEAHKVDAQEIVNSMVAMGVITQEQSTSPDMLLNQIQSATGNGYGVGWGEFEIALVMAWAFVVILG